MVKNVFRIACGVLAALGVLFFIYILIITRGLSFFAWESRFLDLFLVTSFLITVLSLSCLVHSFRKDEIWLSRKISLAVATVLMIAQAVVFILFLPKHSVNVSGHRLMADPRIAKVDYYGNMAFELKNNPFEICGYIFHYVDTNKKTGYAYYDPVACRYWFHETIVLPLDTELFHSYTMFEYMSPRPGVAICDLRFADTYVRENYLEKIGIIERHGEDELTEFLNITQEADLYADLTRIAVTYLAHYQIAKADAMPAADDITISFELYGLEIAKYQKGNLELVVRVVQR